MRWSQAEYYLKGIFLGLLLFAALQNPDWSKTGQLALFLGGGLAAGLFVSLVMWLMRGIRIGGRFLSLILFLLLESPTLVYLGLIGGMLAGALSIRDREQWGEWLLPICVGGGALVGVALGELKRIGPANWRFGAALAGAVVLVGAALYVLDQLPEDQRFDEHRRMMLGVHLLLGLPFFYLLTFAGEAEETEGEIALICAGMALGVWLLRLTPQVPAIALLIPIALYVLYTRYILGGLRVFKHTLRGYSYFQMGRIRPALRSFRRAVELDPNNQLALTGLAKVHSGIDVRQLKGDPETVALLDLDLCLNRAGKLLWQREINPNQLQEVGHLLDLVAEQRPARLPEAEYWRAVADMRAQRPESAAERLGKLLDPAAWAADAQASRWSVLLPAWQMALLRSKDLATRVGQGQLLLPGRRMEAIAACEKALAADRNDADAWELKRYLYDSLTEADFAARKPGEGEFDAGYARELGMARINDAAHWRRGVEFLRLAAWANPAQAPSLCLQIAQTYERAGEPENARQAYEYVKQSGAAFGPKNLPPEEKAAFFGIVKKMADEAAARGDNRAAIADLTLYAEYERAGLETLRQLAEMYERDGNALTALQYNDRAMVYNPNDRDLLARKDKYYFSVMPDQLRQLPDNARAGLDADYCLNKARSILASRNPELDSIEWALHLADLARVLRPKSVEAQLLCARARLWKGERDDALRMLEDLREAKPAKFENGGDEDAWFRCAQMLGDLYLNEYSRPDLAVPCYLEFRQSTKSGADTLFKLGQAYENLGDMPRAAQYYEQVTGYAEHPRYYDAQDALRRLKGG
jgi:tetratricopeptide (TPR) repeat protein